MEAMARHRTHSTDFKRQEAQDYMAGETLHSLARRHDLSRNLIRIWVQKYEAGAFDGHRPVACIIRTADPNTLPGAIAKHSPIMVSSAQWAGAAIRTIMPRPKAS